MDELIPRLFRTEHSRITAVLCRAFGIEHVEAAEDIASETFALALETWPYRGIPRQPRAWLYAVAKNKARNYLQRRRVFDTRVTAALADGAFTEEPVDLSEKNISDSRLQMLFAICQPSIPVESQIGLALRILCGFGINEIATAFLSNRETITKRLMRAREKLRAEKIAIVFPGPGEIPTRIGSVLTTLYLFFNEGYYSESHDSVLREDLCLEAIRLTHLLTEYEQTNLPEVNALLSLMCFHASRFPARRSASGGMVLYADQDESLWNQDLIARGGYHLKASATGNQLSRYHVEAQIAWWHTQKSDTREKWENILYLYNVLLTIAYSPVAALNRTYAYSKVHGNEKAIHEAEKLRLENNRFYHALLGELYLAPDRRKALTHLRQALLLTTNPSEQTILEKKIEALGGDASGHFAGH